MGDLDLPMHSQTNYSVEPVNKYLIAIGVRDRVYFRGVLCQVTLRTPTAQAAACTVGVGVSRDGEAEDMWACTS
jgi:hypothetical protein